MKMKIDFSKLVLDVSWYSGYDTETKLEILNWFLKTGKKHREKSGWYEYGVSQHIFGYSANECDAYFPIPILYKKVSGEFGSMNINVLDLFFQSVFTNAVLTNGRNAVLSWRKDERILLGKYRMLDFPMENPEYKKDGCGRNMNTFWFLNFIGFYVGNKSILHDIKLCTIGNGYICEFSVLQEDKDWFGENIYKTHELHQEKSESIGCFINRVLSKIEDLLGTGFFKQKIKGEYET